MGYWKKKYGKKNPEFKEGVIAGVTYCSTVKEATEKTLEQTVKEIEDDFAPEFSENQLAFDLMELLSNETGHAKADMKLETTKDEIGILDHEEGRDEISTFAREIMMALEQRFTIEIGEAEYLETKTVADIIKMVRDKVVNPE